MSLQLEADNNLASLTLLDGSHSYVAAHTEHYKSKMAPGDMMRAQTEALVAFVLQFTTVDYSKVKHINTKLRTYPPKITRLMMRQ